MLIHSTNAAKPYGWGNKDLRNKLSIGVSRRDNVKTKGSAHSFISEDLSWNIVLFCMCDILSKYIFSKDPRLYK